MMGMKQKFRTAKVMYVRQEMFAYITGVTRTITKLESQFAYELGQQRLCRNVLTGVWCLNPRTAVDIAFAGPRIERGTNSTAHIQLMPCQPIAKTAVKSVSEGNPIKTSTLTSQVEKDESSHHIKRPHIVRIQPQISKNRQHNQTNTHPRRSKDRQCPPTPDSINHEANHSRSDEELRRGASGQQQRHFVVIL